MEQISLTGATLLSDYPTGLLSEVELTSNSAGTTSLLSSSSSSTSSSAHDHSHDHRHHGGDNDDDDHAATCPHHKHRPPVMTMTHPQILALPANIPALVQGGTNAELFEALCTFIRLSRTLEERNDWYKNLLEELQKQKTTTSTTTTTTTQPQHRLWQVLTTTSPDDNGHTLFHWASKRSDDARFLQLLLEHATTAAAAAGVPHQALLDLVNQASVDSVGMTPFHWACTENCQKHCSLLLQYGANLESTDKSGCTPLLIAAQYGHVDLVAILIRRGANGLAVDKSLDTALHWAAYKGSMPVCGVLTYLVPQLSYTTPDAFGQTPLHLAALRGHTSVVRYILANVQVLQDHDNNDGLHLLAQDGVDEDDDDDVATALITTSPRRRQRQRQLLKVKEDLLWLRDSQGRTPLELAIFKQRPTVAALLQHEMDQLKLQQVYHSSSTTYARKLCLWLQHNIKMMCSIHNWKVWMGCRSTNHDEVDESPKFPFYIVVTLIVIQVILYPTVFTPIFAVDRGILWDMMGFHLLNWLFMICFWYCFYKIATTSPGYVGGVGGRSQRLNNNNNSNSNSNSNNNNSRGGRHNLHHHQQHQQQHRQRASSSSTRPHVDSKHSRRRQQNYSQAALTRKWRCRYEQVLDSYALDDDDSQKSKNSEAAAAKLQALRERQLCHTCHIARPLRSKHCRVARRCVLMFDHHCPFVGNTIGLYNYMWFYLTLVFMTICELGFIATWATYVYRFSHQHHNQIPWKIFFLGIFMGVWILPAGGMAIYHTQLSMVNLTTNEHQNLPRYKYLHDPVTGRYRNPWFQGWFYNMVQRFTPSEASYTLVDDNEDDRDEYASGGGGGGGGSGDGDDLPMIQQV